MKKMFSYLFVTLCTMLFTCSFSQDIKIIPQPTKIEIKEGENFVYTPNKTNIFAPKDCKAAQYFSDSRKEIYNTANSVETKKYSRKDMRGGIVYVFISEKSLGEEGYIIDINKNNVLLQANSEAGLFYATQTFMQMIGTNYPLEARKLAKNSLQPNIVSCNLTPCHIEDIPRFAYRGKHLDCCRHFFPVSYIKKYIDILAMHKINTFHWHLTDDQGWRIEIKKYPLLTSVGGWREQTLVGHYSDTDPEDQVFDGKRYGGYYTQEQIRDIVKYALERHINIIPEIELPGHAMAALSAYPELSCRMKPIDEACTWGVFDDVFCSKDETISFLKDVLDEVLDLFPSKYINIGGDETPTVRWAECPRCKEVMKRENISDVNQLQGYFTKIIGTYLESKGRRVIGWDEILDKGVDTSVVILSWQGESGAINAAKKGNDAIMAASAYLYFNFYQGASSTEPLSFGGFTPLKKTYTFEPVSKDLTKEQAKHIIGMQACTWTEYIGDTALLEYNDMPRLAAMCERAWSAKEVYDYDNFVYRLDKMLKVYDVCGINYSRSHWAVNAKSEAKNNRVKVNLSSALKGGEIYYTLDGTEPTTSSIKYTKPFVISKDCTLEALSYKDKDHYSPIFRADYHINLATGKKYKMDNINPQYNAGGGMALTDGLCGNKKSYDRWVGTLGKDYEVVLDLEKEQNITYVSINFLDEEGSWIFLPREVSFAVSKDGNSWTKMLGVEKSKIVSNPKVVKYSAYSPQRARYVKIFAKSIGKCPDDHPGRGYDAHTFADEIEVK